MDRNFKVAIAATLGAGVVVGASAVVYTLYRIRDHVSQLHQSISDVRRELSSLEDELNYLHRLAPYPEDKNAHIKRSKKCVSFSSTTSLNSYKTAVQSLPGQENSEIDGYITSNEDLDKDEEYFDVQSSDDEEYSGMDVSDDVQNLSLVLRRVDALIDGDFNNQFDAYELLNEQRFVFENNSELLWRMAKVTRNLATNAQLNGHSDRRIALLDEAFDYADQALKINDKSSETHKWFAILAGARGEFLGIKDRIESGHIFKKHIDLALQMSPNDSTLHHLLGRFCYEVSLLSWLERSVASTLFADIPTSDFNEALLHFLAAENLKTQEWKENKFFIAKCYMQLSDFENTLVWLQNAYDVPISTTDDEVVNNEILKLTQKYPIET